MKTPIFTDTEAETSADLDETLHLMTKNRTANITKSIFNISLKNLSLKEDSECDQFKNAKTTLEKEMHEWKEMISKTVERMKSLKNEKKPVDISVLPPNKRAYLEQAPNLQKFIRDSLEFREAANIYFNKDFEEALEMQDDLAAVCEYRLENAKANSVSEFITNMPQWDK